LEVIFQSFFLVAVAEMGDKTQLLAFLLASRFRRPWAVFSGIFVATLANHFLAAGLGKWVSHFFSEQVLRWSVAAVFFGFAIWILIPDREEEPKGGQGHGAFVATLIAFFLAEMGDKTQLTTVALAMKYQSLFLVTVGTTLGMMLSNGLPVFFGDQIQKRVDLDLIRKVATVGFVVFGIAALLGF
jgi:putative Ca2+/H+ antiporter (TMEM165/GDT1 family)